MHGQRRGAGRVGIVVAHVSTPVFEGPFDVLLQLVSDHKVDIYDIRLSDLVDAFVAEMAARQPLDVQTASEFLVIAAILVELKSRKLLPGPDEVDDDEELAGLRGARPAAGPPARAPGLRGRRRRLRRAHRAGRAASLPRSAGLEERFRDLAPDLLAGVTPERLAAAFMVGTVPRPEFILDLSHVTVEAVTVSEAVAELEARLPGAGTLSLPGAHGALHDPDADHRALPGPARVVQAGLGHPRPGRDLRRPGRRLVPRLVRARPPSAAGDAVEEYDG